jgi:hypothetical protein
MDSKMGMPGVTVRTSETTVNFNLTTSQNTLNFILATVKIWKKFMGRLLYAAFDDANPYRPDDGGSTHLWNVGQLQRDYTALQPRRL